MTSTRFPSIASLAVALAVLAGTAVIAQDKYDLQVPDGLAFSEFMGYETWQVVSVSHPEKTLNVIVGNPAMIEAYQLGIPGNGKPFPDGAKAARIQYVPKKSAEAPFDVWIPDTLKDVAFMSKDSDRFSKSDGWGYAVFNYDPALDEFSPDGKGSACGFTCHSDVKARDYVFTSLGKR